MTPGLRDVFDTFFRFKETLHEMLESLPASEVLPDPEELNAINQLLDKWLLLTGRVDSDIARYPVWRHITELVEDIERKSPRLSPTPPNSKVRTIPRNALGQRLGSTP